MKVGIFTECYKPILNGVVNSIDGFRKGLTELGHEVHIFCPEYKEKINEKNIHYCRSFPLPGKSGYHYIYPFDLRKESIARTMDIVHTEHPFTMARRALDIAKKYNIPLVFTNHTQYEQYTHYVPIGRGIVKYFIKKWVTNFANQCDLIVAPAKGIEDKLNEYKVKTAMEVVPNGIDLDKFVNRNKNYLKNKYNLKNWPTLIFVGRIAEEKNLSFLVNAFQKALLKNPNLYMVLVGGGPEEKHFRDLISSLNLIDKIFVTGYLPYQEVPDCLSSADIFVSASKTEVHPLTVLEAMASGLPSIVFDCRGTGEVIENNTDGIKTKTNDKNEFVSAILNLAGNKTLCNNLGHQAIEKSKKYSYLETSKIMLKAYEKAIKIHMQS